MLGKGNLFNFCGVFNEVIDSDMQCEEYDDQMFQRTADSLGQADQGKAWEVLEDPLDEAIAGHINDIIVRDDNEFYLFIDFFNCSSVNKNRGKALEDIIDEVLGEVQITVVKSLGVEIANTLKKPADSDEEDSTAL